MSNNRSKMPDFKEIAGMAGKLFRDFKKSVEEIVQDYKTKRSATTDTTAQQDVKTPPPSHPTDIKSQSSATQSTAHEPPGNIETNSTQDLPVKKTTASEAVKKAAPRKKRTSESSKTKSSKTPPKNKEQ